MGKDSSIQWTNHTFNAWWGCVKVSPACKSCYAEAWDGRFGGDHWGPGSSRRFFGDKHWAEPAKWNRLAQETLYAIPFEERSRLASLGLLPRPRVFTLSMGDVFEDRDDLVVPRARLYDLIDRTPFLDWLLLTKRPENILAMTPDNLGLDMEDDQERDEFTKLHVGGIDSYSKCEGSEGDCCWGTGWLPAQPDVIRSRKYRHNVWLGTTAEDQEWADRRVPELLKAHDLARYLFLSVEPMLGPIDLRLTEWQQDSPDQSPYNMLTWAGQLLDWVIVGGESGCHARPFDLAWARSIRDECAAAGVAFFMKQFGANPIFDSVHRIGKTAVVLKDSHGGDWSEWSEDLRVREFPKGSEATVD